MTPEVREKIDAFKREMTFIICSEGRMSVLQGAVEAIDYLVETNNRSSELTERYRKALEVIAGQPQHVLEAMQARAALENIGPSVDAVSGSGDAS